MPTGRGTEALRLLGAALGCAALAGCAAVAQTPAPSNGHQTGHPAGRHSGQPSGRDSGGRSARQSGRRSDRGRPPPSPSPSGLPVSHVSAHTTQPQPPAGRCHARGRGEFSLPDPRCTPGALSPAVTQRTIGSTICRSGYTETVRPSESITEREKEASLAAYGDTGPLHAYEYDHLVSLELGGAPNDPRNLWPEPGASPNPKDTLENRLRRKVCDGETSLAAAQRAIAGDWIKAYRTSG